MTEWSLVFTVFVFAFGVFVRYEHVMDYYWGELRLGERKHYQWWKAMIQFWKSPKEFKG